MVCITQQERWLMLLRCELWWIRI